MLKRIVLGLLALVLLVTGGALATAAIWAHGAFDSKGVMRFDVGSITPDAGSDATIVDIERFGATIAYIGQLGTTRLTVAPVDGSDPIFLGVGATPDVDGFVRGTPYSVAVREGSTWTVRAVPGLTPLAAPVSTSFWLGQDSGRQPSIAIPDARPITVLVTRTDGSATGPLAVYIDFTVAKAPTYVLGMAIAAGVLVLIGIVLLVLAFRRRAPRGRHAVGDGETPTVVVSQPVVDEPVVDEPVVDEPVVDEPVVDEPAVDEPVVDEPAVDEPAVDEPAVDEPVVDEPVVEDPEVAAEHPVVQEHAVEEPVTETLPVVPADPDGPHERT